jgi:hypothetical protein
MSCQSPSWRAPAAAAVPAGRRRSASSLPLAVAAGTAAMPRRGARRGRPRPCAATTEPWQPAEDRSRRISSYLTPFGLRVSSSTCDLCVAVCREERERRCSVFIGRGLG